MLSSILYWGARENDIKYHRGEQKDNVRIYCGRKTSALASAG